jgi:opacity protein-like surface antigen
MTLIAFTLTILTATAAHAESGRTADGCTYRILNGQYLTDCSNKKPALPAASAEEAIPAAPLRDTAPEETVGSYGDVPVRQNPFAPVPSVQIEAAPLVKAPETLRVPLRPAPGLNAPTSLQAYETTLRDFEESRRQRRIDRLVERPYVGVTAGATTISNTPSGSAGSVGVTVGTLLDEYFGVEIGYTYARQGLNLTLPNRSGGTLAPYGQDDSSLRSHLVNVELQGYVTNALRRFRPFLGLGFGFKSSSLTAIADPTYAGYVAPNSLSQTSFGGSASAGAKFRVAKSLELAASFRYFFPFARQSARLEQTGNVYGMPGASVEPTVLRREDDELTGSSQYQFAGGLLYSF